MQVSVIIPTLNEAPQIAETIARTRQAGACEIVVVDGGSTDETLQCASDADVVVTAEAGRSRQQNRGAAEATGDVLVFLHADCWLDEGSLIRLVNLLTEMPRGWGGFRQRIENPRWIYRWIERGNELRVRLLGWIYGDQAIFVTRKAFEENGGFPDVDLMEDLYICKRLKRDVRPLIITSHCVHVSARRWEQRGSVRQTLQNWWMVMLAHLGVPLSRLSLMYRHVR